MSSHTKQTTLVQVSSLDFSAESVRHVLARVPGASLVNCSFADLTSLRIGGRPAGVVRCSSAQALHEVVGWADSQGWRNIVVGGGSNLVVGEEVSDLLVIWAQATLDSDHDPATATASDTTRAAENSATSAESSTKSSPESNADLHIHQRSGIVRAYAGLTFDDLVARTVDAGLGGLECLSGIPGSVGATPVQNVGAYGAEVSQVLSAVQLHDRRTGSWVWVDPAELDLSYRYSNLKFTNRAVVTAVEFELHTDGLSAPLRYGELARALGVSAEEESPRRAVADVRRAVLELRRGKGMVLDEGDHDTWSAGSFFTNPIVQSTQDKDAVLAAVRAHCGEQEVAAMPVYDLGGGHYKFSAAWLIERAGFPKGYCVPGHEQASLSTKHTLALTNRGAATSADIRALAQSVRSGVRAVFGVELEPEPIFLGLDALD